MTSRDCWPNWSDQVIFQLGKLQATANRQAADTRRTLEIAAAVLAILQTMQTAPPPKASGPTLLVRIVDLWKKVEQAQKFWRFVMWLRAVSWTAYGYGTLRYLGWL